MLELLRKNKKSVIHVMLAGFIVILMVGFGVDSYNGQSRSHNAVIKIDGTEITDMQFSRKRGQLEATMRQKLGPNFDNFRSFLNIGQRTIDAVVMETLVFRLVDHLGFSASPRLIRERIESLPFFQVNGLTESSYEMYRKSQGLTAEAFEETTRKEVAASQLEKILVDLSAPSKSELKGAYRASHTTVSVSYVAFQPKEFESKVVVEDAKLQEFFERSAERYRSKKAVKFSWLALDPETFAAKVELGKTDLQDLYEEKSSELIEPKKARLRQVILLKDAGKKEEEKGSALEEELLGARKNEQDAQSAAPKDEEQKKKASTVLDRLNAGEEFEAIAKDISEDKTTKDDGGNLGWIELENLDAPTRTAVDALKPGETSDVIETSTAFKVVKLEEIREERQKPLEEVKDQLEKEQRALLAPEYARVETEALYETWRSDPANRELSLVDFAKKNSLEAKTTANAVGADSPPQAGQDIPAELTEKALALGKGDRELISVGNADYLVEVLEVRESSVPPFAEVKDRVSKDYVAAQSKILAKKAAEDLLNMIRPSDDKAKERKTLAAAAQETGATVKQGAPISRAKPATDPVFSNPDIQRAVFTLSPARPVPRSVVEGGDTYYTLELRERTAPPDDEVTSKFIEEQNAEKEKIEGRVISFLLATLKATADIWVDPNLLEGSERDFGDA